MKFKINRDHFSNGLAQVLNVVGSKATMPILSNVLIEAEKDGITLTTTNLDLGIRAKIKAEVKETGAVTLPVKRLAGIVRERAPRTSHWIERMNHPNPAAFTGFLAGDRFHGGMSRLLSLFGADAVPVLLATLRDFEAWADAHAKPGGKPPRATGFHVPTASTAA